MLAIHWFSITLFKKTFFVFISRIHEPKLNKPKINSMFFHSRSARIFTPSS